jgi:hypothetical protein
MRQRNASPVPFREFTDNGLRDGDLAVQPRQQIEQPCLKQILYWGGI